MVRTRQSERGVYFVVVALMLSVILGFGALAVDISYVRLAQAQAQDVADAASQAALLVLRRSGDETEAQAAAEAIISLNQIAGEIGTLELFETGDWDPDEASLDTSANTPNGVRVTVERADTNALDLLLAPVLGVDSVDISASATSAARDLDLLVLFDITNSWSRPNFYEAVDAGVAFHDVLANAHGPQDRMGFVVFYNKYAYSYTDWVSIEDAVAAGDVRSDWADLETASRPGTASNNGKGCHWAGGNNYASPAGGCFSHMPREYSDEYGTDHSISMEAAIEMFDALDDSGAYRAVLLLTDGQPAGSSSASGTARAADGYAETRWPEFVGTSGRGVADIKTQSVAIAEEMWDTMEINVWTISFNSHGDFLDDMSQGDGYYTLTSDASELEDIFVDIANSLPMAIVE